MAASLCLGGAGCALDHRTLSPDPEQSAGSPGSGGTNSGAGGTGNGTAMVHGKPPSIDLPECSYSTTQIDPGCDTMVQNAGFTGGIDGWVAEPIAIKVDWEPRDDATGSDSSGAIVVTSSLYGLTNGVAFGGGRQCVPVQPRKIYDIAGDVFIPEGQGEGAPSVRPMVSGEGGAGGDTGQGGGAGSGDEDELITSYVSQAGLGVLFWPLADCADEQGSINGFQTELVSEPGAWTHVEGTSIAPDKAVSMSVRVLTVKPFKQLKFEALFDNVFVQPRR